MKKDVLKELPNKQRSIVEVKINNRRDYETTRKNVRHELESLREKGKLFTEEVSRDLHGLDCDEIKDKWKELFPNDKPLKDGARSTLLRMFDSRLSQREAFIENAEAVLLINRLKMTSMKGKLASAVEWIEDFLDSGEKLVVFCEHIEAQKMLYAKFSKVASSIMSHMDAEERQANVDRFQEDEKTRLIVCSLGAGGVGFTMTASRSVLFFEQGWTPAIHDQAEDRTHRIGQENAVTAYYMLGKDTIDEDIYSLIETKRAIVSAASDGAVAGGSSVISDLIDRLATN